MRPDCQATTDCNCGHFRHPADVLVTLSYTTEPFPICNGTADEWEARFPEYIIRFDPIPDESLYPPGDLLSNYPPGNYEVHLNDELQPIVDKVIRIAQR